MELYAWLVGFLVAGFNIVACTVLVLAESYLAGARRIPGREQLWYLLDRNFFRYGDLMAVTVLDFCATAVLLTGRPSWIVGIVCLILALSLMCYLHVAVWLPRNAGYDSAYPAKGKVSMMGILHLPYFAFQWALGLMASWEVVQMVIGVRPLSWLGTFPGVLGLIAYACYLLIMRSDQKAGRFDGPPQRL